MPLEKVRTESSREALEAPRDRGRGTALCHGPGESLITSGDGSGVRSPRALSAGEEKAEAGDRDPMLAVDHADLRYPSCIVMGAVADCRRDSFPWPASVPGSRAVLMGVGVDDATTSVSSFNALEGARTWYLGTGRPVWSGANEGKGFASVDAALACAEAWGVLVVAVVRWARVVSSVSAPSRAAASVGAGFVDVDVPKGDPGSSMVSFSRRAGTRGLGRLCWLSSSLWAAVCTAAGHAKHGTCALSGIF